uniref:Sulfotransferase n=1 Tax=Leptobrachium leishanense TaxID=445787 RepID=A0A8C5PNY4_9ANUR
MLGPFQRFPRNMNTRKAFIYLLLLGLLICFFYIYAIVKNSSDSISSSLTSEKNPKVHLLIVSSWRSGSSFLGQILNQHKDVFYLYEPGHAIWMRLNQETAERLHYPVRDLLRSLFACDVSPLRPYLPPGTPHIRNIHFFAESRALCSLPVCSPPVERYDRQKCFYSCGNSTLGRVEESCRSHSHVVIKTVRILDLTVLLPLIRDPTLNLKIVHLVRDPRAVAASRNRARSILSVDDKIVIGAGMKGKKLSKEQVMMKICGAQVVINKVAKSSGILRKGRYMLLRHEELAMDPVGSANKVFTFAGLGMNPDLERWIYNVTRKDIKQFNDFLAFSRESAKVIHKWRVELGLKAAKVIELYCQEAMDVFGYLPVKSEKDMKNFNHSLITTSG